MKKILVPIDFSENAINALEHALQLFATEETIFYLVNTYTPAVYQSEYLVFSPGQIGLGDIYRENSERNLMDLKGRMVEKFKNPLHTFVPHPAFNILVQEVIETVEVEKIQLVIMGTQGATGAKEILLGTNAVHIIKKCPCPVLVIPTEMAYKHPKNILFPTDYEVAYLKFNLAPLLQIARIFHSHISILHITGTEGLTEEQSRNKSDLESLLNTIEHSFHDVADQELLTAIYLFQEEHDSDLLVMIQNKHTFFERLFMEPVIKKLGFHLTVPFLVLPPE
ncbi:MAG: universal stress protein [Sediminicola sp.]|tara:strand:+ start:12203 stop:13042 length:840 start_codon:yes stop_codon:yes gene_type:complete